MKDDKDTSAQAAELRRRAEQRLRKRKAAQALPKTEEDTLRLLHELQVYRVELEMQNEQLVASQTEVAAALERYTDLYDFAPVGYFTLGRDGAIRKVNIAAANLLGIERAEAVKRPLEHWIPSDARPAFNAFFQKVFESQTQEACEVPLAREGNKQIVVRIEAAACGGGQECRAVVMDITERTWAQERLVDSEVKYRALAENTNDIAYSVDSEGRLTYVSPQVKRYGYTPEEIIGKTLLDMVDPQDRQTVAADFSRTMSTGDEFPTSFRIVDKQGRDIWFEDLGKAYRDPQGEIIGLYGILRDITDRKRAQEELRAAEAKLQILFKILPAGISIVDKNRRVVDANPALLRILGLSAEGMARGDFVQRQYLRGDGTTMPREEFPAIRAFKEGDEVHDVEIGVVKEDGSTTWVLVSAAPLSESLAAIATMDITDRKCVEEKAHRYRDQLRTLASELTLAEEKERRRLAGDLHDDLVQLLALVKIKLKMLGDSITVPDTGRLAEIVKLTDQAIAAARSVTFQLSPPGLYMNDIDFAAVAERLAESIQQQYGLRVTLEDDGHPKPMEERIRVMLFRGLRELLVNAAKHSKAKSIHVRLARHGQNLRASVRDDGAGFDASTLALSTNGGFGLFNVRERLEYLGGRMRIRSAPGKGTFVALRVPIAPDASKVEEAST